MPLVVRLSASVDPLTNRFCLHLDSSSIHGLWCLEKELGIGTNVGDGLLQLRFMNIVSWPEVPLLVVLAGARKTFQ